MTVPDLDETGPSITADEVHTEFLTELYANQDFAKMNKSAQSHDATRAANDILARYGEAPMTEKQVADAIEEGRRMAKMDPEALIASILDADDLVWWHRFADEATAQNCRQIYTAHCRSYGAPVAGSTLDTMIGVAMSSGEFWGEYRKNDMPRYHNPYVPQQGEKGWRGFFRFVVAVAVDGGAGAASAAGGPIVSGVVGGLASTGADHIIFGGD
ncbi:hypothetical protein HOB10_01640 [Candidatus Parcubacteria bacterium]|nr:hypothetical protein [Candidatus Parcubacteria bacterium]